MNQELLPKPNIFDFGFDKHLNRQLPQITSPVVYNSIEDRLSMLVQSGDTVTTLVPGLQESVLNQ